MIERGRERREVAELRVRAWRWAKHARNMRAKEYWAERAGDALDASRARLAAERAEAEAAALRERAEAEAAALRERAEAEAE